MFHRRHLLHAALYVAIPLFGPMTRAQEQPAASAVDSAAKKPAAKTEKDEAKDKQSEYLKSAIELIPAASPSVQVTALLDAAMLMQTSDRAKAFDLLEQAFRAASGIPPRPDKPMEAYQSDVVRAAARLDPREAAKMLVGLAPRYKREPLQAIITALLGKKELDAAIEIFEANAMPEAYPYRAASALLKQLPADDPRRTQIFSAAAASFNPDNDTKDFAELLSDNWKTFSKEVIEGAVNRVVSAVLDVKETTHTTVNIGTDKGAVTFDSEAESELFNLVAVLNQIDAKRSAAILAKRPRLAAAIEKFPEGLKSMSSGGGTNMSVNRNSSDTPDPEQAARMRRLVQAMGVAADARRIAETDIDAAISRAKDIDVASVRGRTLIEIARKVAGNDRAAALPILSKVETLLVEMKESNEAAPLWAQLVGAAKAAQQTEIADRAAERGLSACEALYKADANADDPNQSPREDWPSVQFLRVLLVQVAGLRGLDAGTMLTRVADPDLQVLGRLAVMRGVMNKPIESLSISVSRGRPRP